jgi:CheY-like chemotaxis protein
MIQPVGHNQILEPTQSSDARCAAIVMATILCIDDEPDALLARKLLLESEGHRVVEARNGKEGLKLFNSEKVDIVVVDYWMGGMNGLAVATEIKRVNPSMPIIMLSGLPELPGEAIGLANRWILKGRSTQELLRAIRELTETGQ